MNGDIPLQWFVHSDGDALLLLFDVDMGLVVLWPGCCDRWLFCSLLSPRCCMGIHHHLLLFFPDVHSTFGCWFFCDYSYLFPWFWNYYSTFIANGGYSLYHYSDLPFGAVFVCQFITFPLLLTRSITIVVRLFFFVVRAFPVAMILIVVPIVGVLLFTVVNCWFFTTVPWWRYSVDVNTGDGYCSCYSITVVLVIPFVVTIVFRCVGVPIIPRLLVFDLIYSILLCICGWYSVHLLPDYLSTAIVVGGESVVTHYRYCDLFTDLNSYSLLGLLFILMMPLIGVVLFDLPFVRCCLVVGSWRLRCCSVCCSLFPEMPITGWWFPVYSDCCSVTVPVLHSDLLLIALIPIFPCRVTVLPLFWFCDLHGGVTSDYLPYFITRCAIPIGVGVDFDDLFRFVGILIGDPEFILVYYIWVVMIILYSDAYRFLRCSVDTCWNLFLRCWPDSTITVLVIVLRRPSCCLWEAQLFYRRVIVTTYQAFILPWYRFYRYYPFALMGY